MISTFTVFIDANVFFGARLRSLVIELAWTGLFRARWSEDIHREWMQAVVKKRSDLTLADLQSTRQQMDEAVPDCLVSGYEALAATLELPDADDRHVLAGAIRGHASLIVTFNLSDFPDDRLAPWEIHAKTPDDFILDVFSLEPETFIRAVTKDWLHYRQPPLTVERYIEDLRKSGVPKTAALLDRYKVLLNS